ncbi:hypothetical protein SCHPADRAFT_899975 [Schizopora paradoxa]|uniref:MYND-type domain-containing protein n=1 Tax=Schizopora paradoxa TaxID=27342 RepID=A0A0H2S1H5_9AGAM|nr:hypothetical protein SCHPADRAFT_899975 [Schizopora paradoxa]
MFRNLAPREIIKALTKARTNLTNLNYLVLRFDSLPERYHSKAFEVFLHHLQKPIEFPLLGDLKERQFVIISMSGLSALGVAYYSQYESHLVQCWPNAIAWAKAIFRLRLAQEPLRGSCLNAIGKMFYLASIINADLLKDDNIFDFAIELWKGDGSEEDDSFSARPILSCLDIKENWIVDFYKRLGWDASFLVRTMLGRYTAAVASNPTFLTIITVTDISHLFYKFVQEGSPDPVVDYLTHYPAVIPTLIKGLQAVLEDTDQTSEHVYAIRCSFLVVATLAPFNINTMRCAIDSGILRASLAFASNPERFQCEQEAVSLMNALQPGLVFRSVASAAVASMKNLAAKKIFDLPQMLQSAPTLFREEWTRFESLLLEQAVIFNLFDNGFAVESGSCAYCKKIANRKDFFKCSGCDILLYCSKKCQECDWERHRGDCKTVNENLGELLSAKISRASRRQGILQANRYWSSIVALARKKEIPLSDLGVQIVYDSAPFKLDVFDCRKVDPSSVESIISKEVLRASNEGLPCIMLKITHLGTVDIYMVYLNDDRGARGDGGARLTYGAIYVDEDNNKLYPATRDVVSDIISQSHALSKSNWRELWGKKPFEILVKEAMEDNVTY